MSRGSLRFQAIFRQYRRAWRQGEPETGLVVEAVTCELLSVQKVPVSAKIAILVRQNGEWGALNWPICA